MPNPNPAIAPLARLLADHLGKGLNQFDTRDTDEQRETLERIAREFEEAATSETWHPIVWRFWRIARVASYMRGRYKFYEWREDDPVYRRWIVIWPWAFKVG